MNKLKFESNQRGVEKAAAMSAAASVAPRAAANSPKMRAVEVSSKVLNRIDDIRVDLLKALPRPWRAGMTEALFIELLLEGLANQYEMGSDGGGFFLIEQLREEFSALPEYPPGGEPTELL